MSVQGRPQVAKVIVPKVHSLGGFEVRRALPAPDQMMVGPFIFFDQMGPHVFSPGEGLDVRPHPHIGLATLTYLFSGAIMHRDSLGVSQVIRPGDVNWMTAGRGIVHSERSPDRERAEGGELFGIQAWIALPIEHEETEPKFFHTPKNDLPRVEGSGKDIRLVCGEAFGEKSPVLTYSKTLYADILLNAGVCLSLEAEGKEKALYIAEGEIEVDSQTYAAGQMLLFTSNTTPSIEARKESRMILFGGDPLSEPRFIWWNFVSSKKEKMEKAGRDWQSGQFPSVPNDPEFIPLPQK